MPVESQAPPTAIRSNDPRAATAKRNGRRVLVERQGRVMTVTLDNPPRNFIDGQMAFELDELTRSLERDSSVGAVILTGAHPCSFITHYDVQEILTGAELTPELPYPVIDFMLRAANLLSRVPGGAKLLGHRRTAGLLTLCKVHEAYRRMSRLDKVFIAAINGTAAAGGCEVALACDVRIMADGEFTIGLTEPVLGFNPGGGGGQRLARAVGPARAVEMLLEARMYTPREALHAGLVHRVVAPDRLLEEAQLLAERLARRAPRAVWGVKRAVYEGFSSSWRRGLHLDRACFAHGAGAPETKRAMRFMLGQIERLPADTTPSPWAEPELLREWQEGTAYDFAATD